MGAATGTSYPTRFRVCLVVCCVNVKKPPDIAIGGFEMIDDGSSRLSPYSWTTKTLRTPRQGLSCDPSTIKYVESTDLHRLLMSRPIRSIPHT